MVRSPILRSRWEAKPQLPVGLKCPYPSSLVASMRPRFGQSDAPARNFVSWESAQSLGDKGKQILRGWSGFTNLAVKMAVTRAGPSKAGA